MPPGPSTRDPAIEAILKDVSRDRIRARIEKLASFGTRHTLSITDSDTRGIGAARRWIKSEFDRMAQENGGRLKVEYDSYIQQPARRVKVATEVVNVVATLPGTQKGSEGRFFVVGGHYDSIRSANEDAEGDAPGANDDASRHGRSRWSWPEVMGSKHATSTPRSSSCRRPRRGAGLARRGPLGGPRTPGRRARRSRP